jgi:TetR/AcrR family transcriptional regulator, transcriptional repressor for nem operon
VRYDNQHKQQTRLRILEAAADAIRAEGPERISVAAVMTRAGLTHGGFYAHFDSKEMLVAATIDFMFDRDEAKFVETTRDRSASEALAVYIDFYLSIGHCGSRGTGCAMASLVSELPHLNPTARDRFTRGALRLHRRLMELLERVGVDDAKSLALTLRSAMVGALAMARAQSNPADGDAILQATRVDLLQRLGMGTGA